jgi:hypothetical protein
MAQVAEVIHVAVAPVFLLSGLAALLAVLTNRLARIIDRARTLESSAVPSSKREAETKDIELITLSRRIKYINLAITLCTIGALLVCLVIASLFIGTFWRMDLPRLIVYLFTSAMFTIIGGLLSFLKEIFVATKFAGARFHRR